MTPKFRVFHRATTQRDNALACDIAACCADALLSQLASRNMQDAELRGYVRARALPLVRAKAYETIAERNRPISQAEELISIALERTVQLLIRNLQTPPIVAIPAPHVLRRAAA